MARPAIVLKRRFDISPGQALVLRDWITLMKRFTETTKWDDPWFMNLSPTAKLLWFYLLDHCDNAGVVDPNMKLMSLQLGETVQEEHFLELGDRLQTLPNRKLHIPKFVGFQFGKLGLSSKVHVSVLNLLGSHQIKYPFSEDTLPNGYVKGINTLQEKEKEKEKEPEGVQGEDFSERIYQAYPLKVGKPAALKAIRKALTKETPEALLKATVAFCAARNGNLDFCPHPSTWFNQERWKDDSSTWARNEPAPNGHPNGTQPHKSAEEILRNRRFNDLTDEEKKLVMAEIL